MTINNTDVSQYLLQPVVTGYEYRNGDEGYTANGTHYQNIVAKKVILTIKFKPLTPAEYAIIRDIFESTDEYSITTDVSGASSTKSFYKDKTFKGTNIGNKYIKDVSVELKEI